MLLVTKSTSNNIFMTLTEKTTFSPADFAMVLTNDQTGAVHYANLTDISTWPGRYNEFVLVENDTLPDDPTITRLNLIPGWYSYTCYDMVVASPASDPAVSSNWVEVVEIGKMLVVPTATAQVQYDPNYVHNEPTYEG